MSALRHNDSQCTESDYAWAKLVLSHSMPILGDGAAAAISEPRFAALCIATERALGGAITLLVGGVEPRNRNARQPTSPFSHHTGR
jgi:hypothetical protein